MWRWGRGQNSLFDDQVSVRQISRLGGVFEHQLLIRPVCCKPLQNLFCSATRHYFHHRISYNFGFIDKRMIHWYVNIRQPWIFNQKIEDCEKCYKRGVGASRLSKRWWKYLSLLHLAYIFIHDLLRRSLEIMKSNWWFHSVSINRIWWIFSFLITSFQLWFVKKITLEIMNSSLIILSTVMIIIKWFLFRVNVVSSASS